MSFSTKFAMWWGSVTTKTEKLFNKEKERLVTHEYYDNPNPKYARPKSIHSIRGSMRASASLQNSNGNAKRSRSFRQQEANESGNDADQMPMGSDPGYGGVRQAPYTQNYNDMQQYPQGQQYTPGPQYIHQQHQGHSNRGYGQVY
ncbi:hypothetical protein LDHU3_17.1380:CDS1 [Leishmania donovani]|uniref:Uncharacterized protein n=3 Tax=Leishmania donovani species complex TaxID=38574 RepID=A4HXG4_LEIIN|nr:hypothetical protein, unknown function [Leishmania infantum JPCM5]CAC9478328.1 hypothetical_protein_-_conserved [Leishmania infantum]CAJ1987877.1 hypothetical protein LDHU3_17.1380:CDS1 [Leishmania donovani]CAM59783.1 hypothetical protein, unknown function [Leishmania infantum JPCM5]SUZ40859.1 hypothetical_protein_-_conserved [Leishmania infantum]VDZ43764.1 hypothetical_protein_conserved [Leishmania donovani]|eukprot:XP_001464755.1 hypothetical protein, unknown function [Leishmania infantum JPCM5]